MSDNKIKIAYAAKLLGLSPMGLRMALRNGRFSYFGEAWKNEEKWTYYVNANRLYEYLGKSESEKRNSNINQSNKDVKEA